MAPNPAQVVAPLAAPGPDDIALVLGGGGAWMYAEAYELITILGQRPDLIPKIKLIAGNSDGAITAVLLAAGIYEGRGPAVLKEALESVSEDTQIISTSVVAVQKSPLLHPLDLSRMAWGGLFGHSVVSQNPLWQLLEHYAGGIDTNALQEKCGVTVQVRGFDSAAGVGRVYSGYLAKMAKKSSAIEGVFQDHNGISDGGPVDNCPADLAIQAGFKRILICYCGPEGPLADMKPVWVDESEPDEPKLLARQVVGNFLGSVTSINENITAERLAAWEKQGGQLVEAYPAQDAQMGSILDFSKAAQAPRVLAGIRAGVLALQGIKALGW